ncbi:hypothetical protein [Actinomadura hibisca]|uniref:hypothetical protein n=1 Tax=Actinomadura hibisca TaxID=68565 RepID=UPI00082F9A93|nr:hypothetical protein [Actinomadura hibisca]
MRIHIRRTLTVLSLSAASVFGLQTASHAASLKTADGTIECTSHGSYYDTGNLTGWRAHAYNCSNKTNSYFAVRIVTVCSGMPPFYAAGLTYYGKWVGFGPYMKNQTLGQAPVESVWGCSFGVYSISLQRT